MAATRLCFASWTAGGSGWAVRWRKPRAAIGRTARGGRCSSAWERDHRLSVEIVDDGVGYDIETAPRAGQGLANMSDGLANMSDGLANMSDRIAAL